MKKTFIITAVALVTVIMGITYLFSRPTTSSAQVSGVPQSNPILASSSLSDYAAQASVAFAPLPTSATLDIGTAGGTVTVNNFYASDPPVDTSGYVIFKITQNYLFDYDPSDSSFWIGIGGIPFSNWQISAEQDFLATLGISKSDACKLTVVEGVIYDPNNTENGQSFPLTFCDTSSSTFAQ
jgi:hypothetical protein